MTDRVKQKEAMLELQDDESLSTERLDSQVQKAQEQLVQLKRQQEQIEKQKRELEELSKRQEQFQQGKSEMTEKFTRALVVLERETYEAQKRVEQLKGIHESFAQHLGVIEAINPKNWENSDINKELSKALSAVDDARADYAKSRSKINAESNGEILDSGVGGDPYAVGYVDAMEKGFIYWLKSGFAFTLPLVMLGVIILIVLLMRG